MRAYPRNSPEAAARIVALVLISDGHVSNSESEALNQLDYMFNLGMNPRHFAGILQTLCEDLLMEGFTGGSLLSQVDDASLASVMAEVDLPELRDKVLRMVFAGIKADKNLSNGETSVLDALDRNWGRRPVTLGAKAATARLSGAS